MYHKVNIYLKFMMNYIKKMKDLDTKICQYMSEINGLNFKVFKILVIFSLIVNSILSVMTFIPNAILAELKFRVLFISALSLLISSCIVIYYMKDFILKHSIAFLYTRILISQIFFLILEKIIATSRGHEVPFTLVAGFLLIQPIITFDKNVRIILWTTAACTICTAISFFTKPFAVALNDLINCSLFTMIGITIGIIMRTYIINYTDMTLKENKAKSEFLALVSHELRTPLNVITGFNEMILRELTQNTRVPNADEMLEYSKEIKVSCRTLTSIISDILDFSKITSGDFNLLHSEYRLDSILNDILNMIKPSAHEKGLSFDIKIKENTPNLLIGDNMRIKQCLINLLLNAVKYTDKGEVILDIDWEMSESDSKTVFFTFTVTDTGTGIKEEDIKRITSPFERLNEMRKRGIDGTGLGLSIVEGILQKMDSDLIIKSEYGIGSSFSFTIRQHISRNIPIGNFNIKTKLTDQGEPSSYRSFIAPAARILVVDDLQMNLTLICSLLKCTQMQIDTATSGKKALELINSNHYNVVFIDHLMPVMDGVETLHAIKIMNISSYADTKYIALTANAAKDSRQLYLNEGFDDYLPKPVDCEELEKMLIKNLPAKLVKHTNAIKETEEKSSNREFLVNYRSLKGVDYATAIKYCKTDELLQTNVRTFCEDADQNIKSIRNDLAKGEMKNYTITVHALKTALRLIGLTELSEQAAYLEQCGSKNDTEAVNKHTEDFLLQLSQWAERLKQTHDELPAIPQEEYTEALNSLKECALAGDLKMAERILKMMAEYKLPDTDAELINSLNQAVRNKNIELFSKLIK